MGVSIDSGDHKRKPVDAELNLVPFIDLLVCCICFLLITAVWTEMARISVDQNRPGQGKLQAPETRVKLTLLVAEDGYTLTAGASRVEIPRQGSHYDTSRLARQLRDVRARLDRGKPLPLTIAVADGVAYRHLVRAMDLARQSHFAAIRLSDASLAL